MEYIWKKFPEEIIKGDNITESGFNLAVEGLGKYLAAASGLFMVLVCGSSG